VAAPFDGVITQRNVDVGTLVQGNATSGTFIFEIMQEDVIRVRVYVPQDAAFGVAPGIDAMVRVPEIPDREFRRKSPSVSVPAEAIIFNRDGMQVAVVNNGGGRVSQSEREARSRHKGGSRHGSKGGRSGDPQSAGQPIRWQQGPGAPTLTSSSTSSLRLCSKGSQKTCETVRKRSYFLRCKISKRPMPATGHFRPIRPVLPAGSCLIRPESGPEAGRRWFGSVLFAVSRRSALVSNFKTRPLSPQLSI